MNPDFRLVLVGAFLGGVLLYAVWFASGVVYEMQRPRDPCVCPAGVVEVVR